jgi:TPP-dependent pyruvate/acetoin dehydrogenase alpha subunit
LSAEDEAAMTAEIDAEIDDALTFARGSAFPAAEELFQYVFPS